MVGMKRISILLVLGLLVWAGLYLRFFDLGQKPMHTDEAVNAVMVHQSLLSVPVEFDPSHYHGPLLKDLAIVTVSLAKGLTGENWSEVTLRFLTALAGSLSVFAFFLLRRHMGRDASFIALFLAAVSPPLVYYSRYFIHETLFILFSLLFLHALWSFLETRKTRWAFWTGATIGVLHAVRETFIFVLFAAVVALFVAHWRESRNDIRWLAGREGLSRLVPLFAAAVGVSVLFYSAFFTHWQGPLDSILTYFRYEIDADHEKPWYYYLMLIIGERSSIGYLGQAWILVLSLAGIWKAFFETSSQSERLPFLRFLCCYTIVLTILYSLISYKTPWLMLNFLVGWILLAGVGWVYSWQRWGHWMSRAILIVLLLGTLGHSLRQGWLLSFRYSADPKNPFVYSHTSPDLLKLVDRIHSLSRLHPDGASMRVDIHGPEYWPLPWYLRDLKGVAYPEAPDENSPASVHVFSFQAGQYVPELDETRFISELRGLRDGVFLLIYIELNLWDRLFEDE